MAFVSPVAFALLGVAAVVVVLHLLGRRAQTKPVPSVVFWRGLRQPSGGLDRGRRRLTSLLLLLDLLVVASIVTALAQPSLAGGPARNLIILVDASASMLATDVPPSRFVVARQQAADLVSNLREGDSAVVVRVGTTASLVGSTADGPRLRDLIAAMPPGSGSSDFSAASIIAATKIDRTRWNEVIVLSDGGGLPAVAWPPGAEVKYRPIGLSDDNQGITALSVRSPGDGGRARAFARVANSASRPIEVPVAALADGSHVDRQVVRLPARGEVELDFDLPPDAQSVELRLGREDALSLDDRAFAVVAARSPVDVLLVSDQPFFLERALRLQPDVQLRVVAPTAYTPDEQHDVVVLDRFLPSKLPSASVLLIGPSSPVPVGGQGQLDSLTRDLTPLGELDHPSVVEVAADDPLLRGVDLEEIEVRRARQLAVPEWARQVVASEGGPLMLRGSAGSRRVVAISFGLADSDLPVRTAFPSLLANAVDWLRPLASPTSARLDTVVELHVPRGWSEVTATGPDGPAPLSWSSDGVALLRAERVGVYTIAGRSASGRVGETRVATSLLDEHETSIGPLSDLPSSRPSAGRSLSIGRQEVWWTVLLAASLVLLIEWWWYHRGRRSPSSWRKA